ncbi:MAG: hypothetical protein ABIM89_16645 [Mycobacteriales bacterium]
MRSRTTALACGLIMTVALGAAPAAAAKRAPRADRAVLQQRLAAAAHGLSGHAAPRAGRNTSLVGALGLPGGLHGDVWSHRGTAYVGTWSGPCPGTGVKIIDASNPASPRQIATAGAYPNTSAEDMQVAAVATSSFSGDLLAIGLQDCGLPDTAPGRTGVDLWDVTDPAEPTHLGFFDTGSGGTHEVSLTVRRIAGQQRVFALAAVPFAEVFSTLFTDTPRGDFQLVDVTDPAAPVLADDWGAGKDGGLPFGAPFLSDFGPPFDCTPPGGGASPCRGHFPSVFNHSASPSSDGMTAYLAYWDIGAVVLDMTDPSDLQFVGRTIYPMPSEGDTHSAMPNAAGTLLATTDEDFSPAERKAAGEPKLLGDTWGFARLWGLSDPSDPEHLSDVTTPHSLTGKTDAFYSAHNPEFVGDTLSVSWYSDGVRFFDVSDPRRPVETGFYRPHPTLDPTGVFAAFGAGDHPIAFVWGVHNDAGLTYLSDINYGLYIIRREQ